MGASGAGFAFVTEQRTQSILLCEHCHLTAWYSFAHAMEPPVRLEHSPGEALSSSAALSDVAAAVERDGIVVLRREKGLRPDELVDFMQR